MNLAPVAEEIREPQRNIPVALLIGVALVIALYLGANFAYALVIPQKEMAALAGDKTVATEYALRLIGPLGAAAASAAIMTSVFGALNGNILVGPRLLYAMGKDGLAPASLQRVHPRYQTPSRAIWVLSCWAMIMVLTVAVLTEFGEPVMRWVAGWEPLRGVAESLISTGVLNRKASHFDLMTNFAMFAAVIFETMAVMTVFVFRWKRPDAPRPYRCFGYPVTPALYLLLPGYVIFSTLYDPETLPQALTALAFVAAGVVVYYAFGLWRGRAAP
jgi:amino acid transporter